MGIIVLFSSTGVIQTYQDHGMNVSVLWAFILKRYVLPYDLSYDSNSCESLTVNCFTIAVWRTSDRKFIFSRWKHKDCFLVLAPSLLITVTPFQQQYSSVAKSTRTVPWCWFVYPWSLSHPHNNSTALFAKSTRTVFLGVGLFIHDHCHTHTTTVQLLPKAQGLFLGIGSFILSSLRLTSILATPRRLYYQKTSHSDKGHRWAYSSFKHLSPFTHTNQSQKRRQKWAVLRTFKHLKTVTAWAYTHQKREKNG